MDVTDQFASLSERAWVHTRSYLHSGPAAIVDYDDEEGWTPMSV